MWHSSQFPVKMLGGALGIVCLYMAVFLYRDEREEIQNHLEDWWQKIRNKQETALSKHVVLMQTVGEMTTRLFDRVFGNRYFSVRAIVGSICLSMTSMLFLYFSTAIRGNGISWLSDDEGKICLVSLLVFLVVSVISLRIRQLAQRKAWLALIFLLALLQLTYDLALGDLNSSHGSVRYVLTLIIFAAGILVASFGCDLLFIAATRWAVRWASGMNNFVKISSVIFLNLSIAAGLFIYPLLWSEAKFDAEMTSNAMVFALRFGLDMRSATPHVSLSECVLVLSSSNAIDGLVASVYVVLAMLMLVHRVLWPLLARPIYALADLGVIRQRKLLGCVGLALLGFATGKMPEFAKQVIDAFVSK